MRILIFTTDLPPLHGVPTSGTALRTYGFAQGFRAHGHEVILSVPKYALYGFKKSFDTESLSADVRAELRTLEQFAFDSFNQADVLGEVQPDLIFCGHWPAYTLKHKPSQLMVMDLAGPHLLERHYQKAGNQDGAILGKMLSMAKADYYVVSGQSQRLYFLSFLFRAGIEKAEQRLITAPMPLDPQLPPLHGKVSKDFPHFLFGGVFLPWQNPSWGLQTLVDEIERRGAGHLQLIGGKHPNYPVQEGHYKKLFKSLAESSHVSVQPMLPFEEFTEQLAGADVAFDVMNWNLERELALTIRSTTYLWSGLPVIYNDFADLGQLIRKYDAGWLVSPGDEAQLSKVLDQIYSSPDLVLAKQRNAQQLAREEFSWDKAVLPILNLAGGASFQKEREVDLAIDFPGSAELLVHGENRVEQQFVCRINGLSKVECKISTHQRDELSPLSCRLIELNTQGLTAVPPKGRQQEKILAEKTFDAAELKNSEWLTLTLPPQKKSAGKILALQLSAPQAKPQTAISPWNIKTNDFPTLALYYGNREMKHNCLSLRTICSSMT